MGEHYCCSFQMDCCSHPARCELQCHIFILEPLYSLEISHYWLCDSFVTADGSHLASENETKKHGPDWLGSFRTAVDRGQIKILFIKGHPVMKPDFSCPLSTPNLHRLLEEWNSLIRRWSCKLEHLTGAWHTVLQVFSFCPPCLL